MALQITGKVEFVGPITNRQRKNGTTLSSREFVLDCTRYNPDTGEPWENHPKFELTGDKCNIIDGFAIGQRVTVDFSLRGVKYTDEQTGEVKYFTSIGAFKVTAVEQSQPAQASPAPAAQAQAPAPIPEAENPDKLPF